MTKHCTAPDTAAELKRTTRAQADAADPTASVWVSANAGTGKTHVLTMRVLRLLLAGTLPERILCLTYTKAAASEMSKRVFGELAKWVTLPDQGLVAELEKLVQRQPNSGEADRARTLFTASIETPGGFKVQTIHAFAERLLQRFPLEAGVTPGFSILDDQMARTLRREAIDEVLSLAARQSASKLKDALQTAIAYAADDRFDDVLTDAIGYRTWLDAAVRLPQGPSKASDGLDATEDLFTTHFGVRLGVTAASVAKDAATVLPAAELKRLADVFSGGSKRDQDQGRRFTAAYLAPTDVLRTSELADIFLDSSNKPRGAFATKAVMDEHPEVEPLLRRAQGKFIALWSELKGAQAVAATMALHRLADAVLQRYKEAKARRAALDFEDLIFHTRNLLLTRGSAEWVLYKLDNGLDHLLVDESQDTSPDQWQVVAALAQEFFSGHGARDEARTIFAVGDEKQSIYSFQGAEPDKFAVMGEMFSGMAKDAGAAWRRVELNMSFRTVAPVLSAVDTVFSDASRTPGVTPVRSSLQHIAKRAGQAGSVEVWPTEAHDEPEPADAWSPLQEAMATLPASCLANRIAETIQNWLTTGEQLPSGDRPVRPGDILILVRKRQPFAAPMVAALKARGIPVAGADRIRLTDQIAVQDLMSLGDFLTLPEDDLSLAEVLKSPICDLDDDDLLRIAHGRKGTLWKALLDNATGDPRYAAAADTLKRWRKAADFSPPYEFWATLLDSEGVRTKLIARLGPDAADPIDEFLNLALTYDDRAPPSLPGFLHAVREEQREIKRDLDHGRDEVRVMTVHGAKGLEAPIVFLPDTCSASSGSPQLRRLLKLPQLVTPQDMPVPFVWPVKGTSSLDAIREARDDIAAKEAQEHHRLLYVAMTRARDRLIIAGFEGKNGRGKGCWYDLIIDTMSGMAGIKRPSNLESWQPVLRLESPQTAAPDAKAGDASNANVPEPLPDWARRPAPREKQLSVPLAPSRLAPYDTDESGDPLAAPPLADKLAEPAPAAPASAGGEARFLRGTLTHALLEHLPAIDPKHWDKAAQAFIKVRGQGLVARVQSNIVKETLSVLCDTSFAALFGPGSRAEVSIVAEIPNPTGRGPALRLTGQIDRLAVTAEEVLIVDYKTNRSSPERSSEVAEVYLFQLAAYRLALADIYPGKTIRAALLWTNDAKLMEIPSATLDTFASRLWQLDPSRLDAPG